MTDEDVLVVEESNSTTSDLYEVVPNEELVEALIDAGFPDRRAVKRATYNQLYSVKGLRKNQIPKLKKAVRDPLDAALDPFRVVADEYYKQFEEEYPDKALVINLNERKLTVGDFRELAKVLKKTNLFD